MPAILVLLQTFWSLNKSFSVFNKSLGEYYEVLNRVFVKIELGMN